MVTQKNAGLIASQNREIRMLLMSNLKAISMVVESGNEEFAKKILGENDWNELTEKGLFQMAYDKTEQVFQRWGFPDRSRKS